jgi:hypothetical protein
MGLLIFEVKELLMKLTRILLQCSLLVLAVGETWAQNARSWVSHNGNDHADCSINHPCRTFQHAHDMTSDLGEVDVLDPGEYGTVRINRPITIDGGNMGYIDGFVAVTVLPNIKGPVFVRNMALMNDSVDILIDWYSSDLHVENVANGKVFVEPQYTILPGLLPSRRLFMHDVTVRNANNAFNAYLPPTKQGQYLIGIDVTVDHCYFEGVIGPSPEGPTSGLDFEYGNVRITNSIISGFDAALVVGSSAEVNLANSSITNSGAAIQIHGVSTDRGGGTVRIGGNNIHDNTAALQISGGGHVSSFGDNRIAGNTGNETPTSTITLR